MNKYNQFIPESIFIQINMCTYCINYYNVVQYAFKTLKTLQIDCK